ncbi:MAG: DNA alkylation repair protein [Planctomycetes bacterium]|nr:DNA alkylation repair protein [Planctomycetota bacterium]
MPRGLPEADGWPAPSACDVGENRAMATLKAARATSRHEQRPDAAALWRRLRAALATQGDAAYRTQIERLVPGIRTHGVHVPALRATAKELKSETDAPTAAALLDLAAASGNRDELLACCFLLASFGKAARALPWTRIERWLQAVDNWETCDQLAMGLAAPALASSPTRSRPCARSQKARICGIGASRYCMACPRVQC